VKKIAIENMIVRDLAIKKENEKEIRIEKEEKKVQDTEEIGKIVLTEKTIEKEGQRERIETEQKLLLRKKTSHIRALLKLAKS